MSWQTGTATDYLDMLDQVVEIATSDHVTTAAVNAGGTGYTVGDILTVVGGTSTHVSTLEVTTVSGGVITGVRIQTGGAYTADPTLTANAVTGGTGTGATMDLTMLTSTYTVKRRSKEAVSATIAAGGTGYTVGDDITLVDGAAGIRGDVSDAAGVAAVFNVDTVSGGVVTAVSLVTAGNYEETPTNPVATTGGTGTGCTLTVTYQDAATQDQVLILESTGDSGTDTIITGLKTFNRVDVSTFETVYNWAAFGMTAYNAGLVFEDQPELSPGVETDGTVSTTNGGAFVPLKTSDAFNISFWMSVTGNRIILVCKVEDAIVTHYSSMYVGFHNPFATTAEDPYPIYIAGCTGRDNSLYTDTTMGRVSTLVECMTVLSRPGPAFFRLANVWTALRNGSVTDSGSPTRNADRDFTVWPYGEPTLSPETDDVITIDIVTAVQWNDIIPQSGVPGSPNVQMQPTPQTGDDARVLVPATLIASDNPAGQPKVYFPIGEIDNVFWVTGVGLSPEDTFDIGDDRYIVFTGNQSEVFSFFAVKAE